jgi:hypothetical protein
MNKNQFREIDWKSVHSPGKEDNWLEFALLEKYLKEAYGRNPDTVAIEVGSFHGLTACLIAQYFPVICIDLWGIDNLEIIETSGSMIGRAESWAAFQGNVEKFGLVDRVFPTCSTSAYLEQLSDIGVNLNVELVFVDACHDAPWPYTDAKRAIKHLSETGVLVFHDAMRYWAGPEYERGMKQEDYIGHGWGGEIIPGDRMGFNPWQGVADGIKQILSEGEFEVIGKAHGMMCLHRIVKNKKGKK